MRTRIVASGWWVVPAAVALTVAVAVMVLRATAAGDRRAAAPGSELALEPSLVPAEALVVGMPPDRLRALSDPGALTPLEVEHRNQEERGKLLVGSDRVIGVRIGGAARAYPLRLLRWHEVVNDRLGGVPIAVTYSGLADLAAVFDRTEGDEVLTFGVSGRLWQSSTLLYDRRSDGPSSLWSPLAARALTGPRAGQPLTVLPAAVCTWADWLERCPATTVLAPDPESEAERLYRRDPYHSYFGSELLRFPVDPLPPADGPRLKDRVLAVETAGGTTLFPLSDLISAAGASSNGTVLTEAGGLRLRLHVRSDPPLAWAETADGRLVPQRFGFWFAWYAADPSSAVVRPQPGPG